MSTAPSGDWNALLRHCGGGFFHSPAALGVGLPHGEPFYAVARNGNGVDAVAFGVRSMCRLSRIARHVLLATPPATRPGLDPNVAALRLAHLLGAAGAAQVSMNSFDAATPSADTATRIEHRLALHGAETGEVLLESCSKTHRLNIRRGERAGWTLRSLAGQHAVELLHSVQQEASARARQRGEQFQAAPSMAAGLGTPLSEPWGVCTFASFADSVLLSVVTIGWANRRAFYLMGGSTPDGYQTRASIWTQWRVMQLCAAAGHSIYNLGGTPAGAESALHSSHGLYCFKTRFGAVPARCKGAEWVFRPAHQRAHKLLVLGARYARRHFAHQNRE